MNNDSIVINEKKFDGSPSMKNASIEYLLNLQNKCCCKIKINELGEMATGFLCKIPFPDYKKLLPVLITNNHVLEEEHILINKEIKFSLKDNKFPYTITIDDLRLTYTNRDYDSTMIQIRDSDKLDTNTFLDVDDNMYQGNPFNYYKKIKIYLLHYPGGGDSEFCESNISEIDQNNYKIKHKASTEDGSSGGPLLNCLNYKVIGIHKGGGHKNNIGIFIKPIIEDFYRKKGKDYEKIQESLKEHNTDNSSIQFDGDTNEILLLSKDNLDNGGEYFFGDILKTKKRIFYFILFISCIISFGLNIFIKFILFPLEKIDLTMLLAFLFISFFLELFIAIFRCFIKNQWFGLIMSLIFEMVSIFLIILDLKEKDKELQFNSLLFFLLFGIINLLKTFLFNIILHFEFEIINALVFGEILSNIIFCFLFWLTNIIKVILSIFCICILLTIILSIIFFCHKKDFLNNILDKGNLKIREINDEEFSKSLIKNMITYLLMTMNFSTTFSLYPIIYICYKKEELYLIYLILFIIFDTIGRYLAKFYKGNDSILKCCFLFDFLINIFLLIFENKIIIIIIIILLGIICGLSTKYGYTLPMNEGEIMVKKMILNYICYFKMILLFIIFIICLMFI